QHGELARIGRQDKDPTPLMHFAHHYRELLDDRARPVFHDERDRGMSVDGSEPGCTRHLRVRVRSSKALDRVLRYLCKERIGRAVTLYRPSGSGARTAYWTRPSGVRVDGTSRP